LGQFAKELAPVYVAYGRSLLQVAIENKDNNNLLNPGAMSETMVEEIASNSYMLSGGDRLKKPKLVNLDGVIFEDDLESDSENGDENDGGDDDERQASDRADSSSGIRSKDAEDQPGDDDDHSHDDHDDDNAKDEDEDEDEGHHGEDGDELQLAWEVLDVARLIYGDSASMDAKAKAGLADVHGDLGDVAMETESFKQAADEFSKAIELKRSLANGMLDHSRELASLYFKMAVALEYDGRVPEALTPLQQSLQLMKLRLKHLQAQQELENESNGKERISHATSSIISELSDLQSLLPEIEAKLDDIKVQTSEQSSRSPAGVSSEEQEIKSAVSAAAHGAIQDLSGLVKKRKNVSE
jgi:tetratricopeptide (TPR) repeat protein